MKMCLPRFLLVLLAFSQVAFGEVIEALAQKWVTRYSVPGALDTVPGAIAVDASGDIYVASYVEVTPNYYQAAVSKLSGTTGAPLWRWQSTFYVTINYDITDAASSTCRLAVGPDGNPVAVFIAKVVKLLGTDGSQIWSMSEPGAFDAYEPVGLYELELDSSGDVIVAGAYRGGRVRKYDRQTGSRLWDRLVSGTALVQAVKTDAAGNIYVTGTSSLSAGQPQKPCTAKLSSEGVILWSKTESDAAEAGRTRLLALDPAGDIAVATYKGRLLKYRNLDGVRLWSVAALASPKAPITFWSMLSIAIHASAMLSPCRQRRSIRTGIFP